jgi:hypothetical protein
MITTGQSFYLVYLLVDIVGLQISREAGFQGFLNRLNIVNLRTKSEIQGYNLLPNIIKKSIILAICAKHGNNEFRRLAHDLSRSDSKTLSLEHVANEFKTLETNLRIQNIQRDVTWHKSNGARQQAFAAPEEQMLDAAGKAVCRLYAKDGNCRYGVKCRFSHKQGVRSGKPVHEMRSTSRVRCYA